MWSTLLGFVALVVAIGSVVPAQGADALAEFTDTPDTVGGVHYNWTQAQAFEIDVSATAEEVSLHLRRFRGSIGTVSVQLRADQDGHPGTTPLSAAAVVEVVNVPDEAADWISFEFPDTGASLSSGKYWIVCSILGSDSDALILWSAVSGNPYGDGADTKRSEDRGNTWTYLSDHDRNFRIFGASGPAIATQTVVSAAPASVIAGEVRRIKVQVTDTGSSPVKIPAPGQVTLTASAGTLADTTLTLVGGEQYTDWTAPMITGNQTITATFSQTHYNGADYASSSGNVTVQVDPVPEEVATTTDLSLDPTQTPTRGSVEVKAVVKDSSDNSVPGGKVDFTCGTGSFSMDSVSIDSGEATTTWTAGIDLGTFPINARFVGVTSGAYTYAQSTDSADVYVHYRDVTTATTARLSPAYPYKGGTAYVLVETEDGAGKPMHDGEVTFSAPSGTFDPNPAQVYKGKAHTLWTAPDTAGDVNVTAEFQDLKEDGDWYLSSTDVCTAHVLEDPDGPTDDLSWMSQWLTNYYRENDIPVSREISRGFTGALSALGWTGSEYAGDAACDEYMMKEGWPNYGEENHYMDKHDFIWYAGHGNPEEITFTCLPCTDLGYEEAEDCWGDNDADWLALFSCDVMAHHNDWANCMKGLHLICGFSTGSKGDPKFGTVFGHLLGTHDEETEAHTIVQSWLMAGDMTQPSGTLQRCVGETGDIADHDHIWGQGYVAHPDPEANDVRSTRETESLPPAMNPVASCADLTVTHGEAVQFDASLSTGPAGAYLYYVWDLAPTVNSDSGNWDNTGGDGPDDDANLWGRRPQFTFPAPGQYNVRLIVIAAREWHTGSCELTVTVNPLSPATAVEETAPAGARSDGGIEIVDDFESLPTVSQLPVLDVVGTALGYNEMVAIAQDLGMDGSAKLGPMGNWTANDGHRELIVNQYSGAVMYFDRDEAYTFHGPPSTPLPPEPDALDRASIYLARYAIQCDTLDFSRVSFTDISAAEYEVGARQATWKVPYQRRVNCPRMITVGPDIYPVVGSGGRISIMLNEDGDVVSFTKICRETMPDAPVPLISANQAVQEFHRLGAEALIGPSWLPSAQRIEIDNVYVAYLEESFVALQSKIYPVYVLELTCEDAKGSREVDVYMPATSLPIDVSINTPTSGVEVINGTSLTFSGSAVGGTPPYTYEWDSDVDGLLGTDAIIDATPSLSMADGRVVEHTVAFRVTDQTGMWGESRIRVKVLPLAGDLDGDADVDADDFDLFVDCVTGADVGPIAAECLPADFDSDDDIDCDDWAQFQLAWTGPPETPPAFQPATETPEVNCTDGLDNDCDGAIDCDDPDCNSDLFCSGCGDGVCDSGEDPCNCPEDCGTPTPQETPGSTCQDGVDNDCDSQIDCDDADCSSDPECEGAIPTVSAWGLIILALVLLTTAKVLFGRRWANTRLTNPT